MLTDAQTPARTSGPSIAFSLSVWLRKISVSLSHRKARRRDHAGLAHLALAAPHVLTDIGFRRLNPNQHDTAIEWQRGNLRITCDAADVTVKIIDTATAAE